VASLAPDLLPAAISRDGLVEGFQHRAASHIVGVQWHPEMMTQKYPEHRKLFRFLVEKAR
jgi:putative glutamine amidotransferase